MKKFTLLFLNIMCLGFANETSNSGEFAYIQPISVEYAVASPSNTSPDLNTSLKTPLDDDKDGVSNRDDMCPKTKLNVTVNTDGCEPDTDKDGVRDAQDECPNTSEDFVVDEIGCPQIAVLKIEFARAKYKVLAQSESKIEEFANFLQENSGYQVIVYGYTDNRGSDSANKQLSRDRANAVMNALVAQGIKLTRLTAIGMGSKEPIADNSTSEGRMKNRRIEVELLQ